MASLGEVSTPRLVGDRYQLDVPAGWRQGRGAFGGLIVGALLRAIEHHTADPARQVRSVTAELPGPVEPGVVEIAVETLRRGNNVSTVRAALTQDGEIRSHAVAVLAATRDRPGAEAPPMWNDLASPAAPPWTELTPISIGPGGRPGPGPEFTQHFEYRMVEGIPASGGPARAMGWVRALDPGPARRSDAAHVAAMIDAWWPAAFIRFTTIRPMATIAFTLDIVGSVDDIDPAAPLLYRASAPICADGYVFETRELWSEAGRLIAINHQTFVVIR